MISNPDSRTRIDEIRDGIYLHQHPTPMAAETGVKCSTGRCLGRVLLRS